MADGLGGSGPGAGLFNRLFDAGLDLGVSFGQRELLGVQPGLNQTTRLGLTAGQLQVNNTARPTIAGIDQQTLLIGAGLIIVAIVLAKAL